VVDRRHQAERLARPTQPVRPDHVRQVDLVGRPTVAQQDDRDGLLVADLGHRQQAVQLGRVDVADNQVWLRPPAALDERHPALDGRDLMPQVGQPPSDARADGRVVVPDNDAKGSRHEGPCRIKCASRVRTD
jgi:hypothetical protein